jgi:hypothetical protein
VVSLNVEWHVQNRVIYVRWPNVLTLDIAFKANERIMPFLNEGTPLIHMIHDATEMKKYPANVIKLKEAFVFLSHPSLGWSVTATSDPMVVFLATVLPQVDRGSRYKVFKTIPEVLKFLEQRDPTIRDGINT